jgi:hypothetical protein
MSEARSIKKTGALIVIITSHPSPEKKKQHGLSEKDEELLLNLNSKYTTPSRN